MKWTLLALALVAGLAVASVQIAPVPAEAGVSDSCNRC